ncbi:hypothetical protein [Alicyclobacillus dauci]|uniref:Uncharacterized protein n=1 Tax=Alicyclobacillus dauci TaxID=1475485 RepID=A0ABY6Z9H3_9BACL|nr:hypothetical protein [Alicyclobacillus dauci]WAH38909.1 hypothetical protein NZD86_10720 [Alicyclobacillus dauci]
MEYVPHLDSDALYRWYEESEEPLWLTVANSHVLSWWLRENLAQHENWFTKGYPTLAPYYPIGSPNQGEIDPMAQYMSYWWP